MEKNIPGLLCDNDKNTYCNVYASIDFFIRAALCSVFTLHVPVQLTDVVFRLNDVVFRIKSRGIGPFFYRMRRCRVRCGDNLAKKARVYIKMLSPRSKHFPMVFIEMDQRIKGENRRQSAPPPCALSITEHRKNKRSG